MISADKKIGLWYRVVTVSGSEMAAQRVGDGSLLQTKMKIYSETVWQPEFNN